MRWRAAQWLAGGVGLGCLWLAVVFLAGAIHTEPGYGEARVLEVVDGATLVVDRGEGAETVRMIGVVAPGARDCFGPEATIWLAQRLISGTVTLQGDDTVPDRDGRGRLLAHVWVGERLISAEAAASGLVATDGTAHRHAGEVEAAEALARDVGAGLWGACR